MKISFYDTKRLLFVIWKGDLIPQLILKPVLKEREEQNDVACVPIIDCKPVVHCAPPDHIDVLTGGDQFAAASSRVSLTSSSMMAPDFLY